MEIFARYVNTDLYDFWYFDVSIEHASFTIFISNLFGFPQKCLPERWQTDLFKQKRRR